MATTSAPAIDYTNIGFAALRDAMLAQARVTLPEWTDQSENELLVVLVDMIAHSADLTMYYQTRIASNLFPETADEPDAIVQLLRIIGYELRPPSPATVDLSLTFASTVAAPFTIPAGSRFTTTSVTGEQIAFETERDVLVNASDLEVRPGGELAYLLPLGVVQGTSVTAEAVGTSDGTPNQRFTLRERPVIAGSVTLEAAEPGGVTRWRTVDTLANSSPADRDVLIQRDVAGAATIVLGDGFNGLVLAAGVPITATYRVGGGPQANVAANSEFTAGPLGPGPLAPTDIIGATNLQAAAGGAVAEEIDRARRLAPRLFRTQDRAVTLRDYEDLALQLPGVGKVRAVALNWNEVVLYVAPTGRVADPSELLRRDVLAYFESRRMASTFVRVLGPRPADIYIRAVVQAQPFYRRADVREAVERAVADYLAFDAVAFGDRIYLSRVYDVIQSLPQVTSLVVRQFSRVASPLPGQEIETDGVIVLAPSELPRPGYRDNPPPTVPAGAPLLLDIQGGVP
jgi:uncharacterized phage protein gp47/JayE